MGLAHPFTPTSRNQRVWERSRHQDQTDMPAATATQASSHTSRAKPRLVASRHMQRRPHLCLGFQSKAGQGRGRHSQGAAWFRRKTGKTWTCGAALAFPVAPDAAPPWWRPCWETRSCPQAGGEGGPLAACSSAPLSAPTRSRRPEHKASVPKPRQGCSTMTLGSLPRGRRQLAYWA